MVSPIDLTDNEKAAKEFMLRIVLEGSAEPCDTISGADQQNNSRPMWFDEVAFKRGQAYFDDNRLAILAAHMSGLVTLLSEPRILQQLISSGRSSTPATASKRYVSTVLHVLSWYQLDLAPDSQSWSSLSRVRRMHWRASRAGRRQGLSGISQADMALTTFAFIGFALIRPHLLGIRHNCAADRAAFLNFWAVMGYMLGVHDAYNMCLLPLATAEIICHAYRRYLFMPLIQLESPQFRDMIVALLAGLGEFGPHLPYQVQMLCVKRLCGIPGYQVDVDCSEESVGRQLFTADERRQMRDAIWRATGNPGCEWLFRAEIPIIEVRRALAGGQFDGNSGDNQTRQLSVQFANPEQQSWSLYMSDCKFQEQSLRDQLLAWTFFGMIRLYKCRIMRYFIESAASVMLVIMERSIRTNKTPRSRG